MLFCKLIVIQFAGFHSFLPVLFGKWFGWQTLLIVAGTDCVSFPSISYGNFNRKLLRKFTKWSEKLAKHISPKHQSLILSEYTYTSDDYRTQGIKKFIPELKTPYTVITNGYDSSIFDRISEKKPRTFLTVAGGFGMRFTYVLKGIDLIVAVASIFEDCIFEIAGVEPGTELPPMPPNIRLITPLNQSQLIEKFSSATYYFQLSMAEGFPNALCEAMLCECVPIGSNVFSIPEIIGDSGFILDHRNKDELIELILKALKSDTEVLGKKARARIIDNYSIEKRSKLLLELTKNLLLK